MAELSIMIEKMDKAEVEQITAYCQKMLAVKEGTATEFSLQDLWKTRNDITKVARRRGNTDPNCYVSMSHKTADAAIKKPMSMGYVKCTDVITDDWYISE